MKNEKHTYHLNTNVMPTIPVPHDCVIKEIVLEEDSLHAGVETLHAGVETLHAGVETLHAGVETLRATSLHSLPTLFFNNH